MMPVASRRSSRSWNRRRVRTASKRRPGASQVPPSTSSRTSSPVGEIALQVKARPDSVTEPVIAALAQLGLFRVFLGVESNAVVGLVTLGRGITCDQNHRALAILREQEIHTCFNLLIFGFAAFQFGAEAVMVALALAFVSSRVLDMVQAGLSASRQAMIITDLSELPSLRVLSSQRLFDVQKQLGRDERKRIDREWVQRSSPPAKPWCRASSSAPVSSQRQAVTAGRARSCTRNRPSSPSPATMPPSAAPKASMTDQVAAWEALGRRPDSAAPVSVAVLMEER